MKIFFTAVFILIFSIIAITVYNRRIHSYRKKTVNIFDAFLPADELITHAKELALYSVSTHKKSDYFAFVNRFTRNFNYITNAYNYFSKIPPDSYAMPSSTEWLLNNYYVLERQFADIAGSVNKKMFHDLPVMTDGAYCGYPRVYACAAELISHTDARIDEDLIQQFFNAYQSTEPLKSVELWMLPTMLKIALTEAVAYICYNAYSSILNYENAKNYKKDLLKNINNKKYVKEKIAHTFSDVKKIDISFTHSLLSMLKKQDKTMAAVFDELDKCLSEHELTAEKIILTEHKVQASNQIRMGNAINSINAVVSIDWACMFSQLSELERVLCKDASGVYANMSTETKALYRSRIEKLAKRYKKNEIKVARYALKLCENESNSPKNHVGYYIIDDGLPLLIEKIGEKSRLIKFVNTYKQKLYMTAVYVLTVTGLFFELLYYRHHRPLTLALLLLFSVIPIAEISLKILNYILSKTVSTRHIPKMEPQTDITPENKTVVVIPVLITSQKQLSGLFKNLEKYYIANKSNNIVFSILGDFKDSDTQITDADKDLLKSACEKTARLNEKYQDRPFVYMHRDKIFNEHDKKWMGYERKRGALTELVRLIKGKKTTISTIYGDASKIKKTRYIITLDADTQLHFGVAKELINTMLHPLNKPVINESAGVVSRGHALLQPRIDITLNDANQSLFTKIFAGEAGLDPYSHTAGDLYQDLFNEGIFTGKGIFDVDTFYKVLDNKIPDNTVLSHDLLEGSYLRAGFVGDIEFTDGYPATYASHMKRLHRWTRGDWQLINWITHKIKNRLAPINIWKMTDNLKRSLLDLSNILLLFSLLIFAKYKPIFAMSVFLLSTGINLILTLTGTLFNKNLFAPNRYHAKGLHGVKLSAVQFLISLAFMPYNAYNYTDAIIRSLYRNFISHKNMLQWTTSADSEASSKNAGLFGVFWKMRINPLMAILLFLSGYGTFGVIISVLWFIAPVIAYYIDKPLKEKPDVLSQQQLQSLRLLSRKTWRYYEDFAVAEDNYLVPDNFQTYPPNGAAHRTSPTNIGMLLAAYLCAYDLGYITLKRMLNSISLTLETIELLPKWNGHLYNWYNTKTLKTLPPEYVSTVDNGNYIGYVITLKQGLLQIKHHNVLRPELIRGILDSIDIYENESGKKVSCAALRDIDSGNVKFEKFAVIDALNEFLQCDAIAQNVWLQKASDLANDVLNDIHNSNPGEISAMADDIISRLDEIINSTDFSLLYDNSRQLFSIGYSTHDFALTKSYYDLFASEARQTSFIAVAKGDVSVKHWFKTARNLTAFKNKAGLISWAGTMFEYLMPLLIMKNVKNSLLDQSYKFALENQIDYLKNSCDVWGISESAFYTFDIDLNYQYKAFGVQRLGLKRGLKDDIVVAPYASVMALMVNKRASFENIKRLRQLGAEGDYGMYEALDFTKSRLNNDEDYKIVKSYMVHHQGMSLLALNNVINDNILQKRFHSEPFISAAEYLLEERMPNTVVINKTNAQSTQPTQSKKKNNFSSCIRAYTSPNLILPNVHILSNGNYGIILNELGGGYSYFNNINVTRRSDETACSDKGSFIYIHDINAKAWWTTSYSPLNLPNEEYKVVFCHDKAEFSRRDGYIDTHTQITVSAEDNTEVRRVSLTNTSDEEKVIEITSYQEITLTPHSSDSAHRTFSNLFITTSFDAKYNTLFAKRKHRFENESDVYAFHSILANSHNISYETDRAKFIGRNKTLHSPDVISMDIPLSNSIGAVIDPVFSLRVRVKIMPGETENISFVTGVAYTQDEAEHLASKYSSTSVIGTTFENANTRTDSEMKYLLMTADEEAQCLQLLSHLIYNSPSKESYNTVMKENCQGQRNLWAYGISGDLPFILCTITNIEDTQNLAAILKCHEYLRLKGFFVDLLILCDSPSQGYHRPLYEAVNDTVLSSHARNILNSHGGVFIQELSHISKKDYCLFVKAASVVISASANSMSDCLKHWQRSYDEQLLATYTPSPMPPQTLPTYKTDFFNGIGGFDKSTNEYVIRLSENASTPLPWINVIANKNFGTVVTESGGGYTWCENSRENRLTQFNNDFVCDMPSESVYIRDNASGYVWTTTSSPINDGGDYIIKYGFGYAQYIHQSNNLKSTQTVFVANNDPVKFTLLEFENVSDEEKDISAVYYTCPVLGSESAMRKHLQTEFEGSLYLSNSYNRDFADKIAFIACSEDNKMVSCDKAEFRTDSHNVPYALKKGILSGKTGGGFDICAAMQTNLKIPPHSTVTVAFILGETNYKTHADALIKAYDIIKIKKELKKVKEYWSGVLNGISVQTPDKALNCIMNGWTLYQTIACRLYARSAFYQSGGAFGFRDQLQDVLSLVHQHPQAVKEQILLHASRQFVEGDVQHWWHQVQNHEQNGKGIRTKFSDDLLWLVFAVCEYIETSGDYSILDETINYIQGEILDNSTCEKYFVPDLSDKSDNLYMHCVNAIDKALKFGEHGMALMGSGDWNDGMNTVGNKGKGESVWLSWFICTILNRFIPICYRKNDYKRADSYSSIKQNIIEAIETNAWDGRWYKRAFFDNGDAIGSAENAECMIDSITQSWAVISHCAVFERCADAMQSVKNYLIDTENSIIKLLFPAFENSDPSPGYIQSYIPGVRENGGQYTHAAVWTAMAFAMLGSGDDALECLDMINPINHTRTPSEVMKYKTEPYAIAADVYSNPQHIGRGGWTWYTGASGWFYKVCIEEILGIKRYSDKLVISPSVPKDWKKYDVKYRYKSSVYEISVTKSSSLQTDKTVYCDSVMAEDGVVPLVDDGKTHRIDVLFTDA